MEPNNKQISENFIKGIRRKTRRAFFSQQKIIIVIEAQRSKESVASIFRKQAISQVLFYKWNYESDR